MRAISDNNIKSFQTGQGVQYNMAIISWHMQYCQRVIEQYFLIIRFLLSFSAYCMVLWQTICNWWIFLLRPFCRQDNVCYICSFHLLLRCARSHRCWIASFIRKRCQMREMNCLRICSGILQNCKQICRRLRARLMLWYDLPQHDAQCDQKRILLPC